MSRPAAILGTCAALLCFSITPASAQFVPSWEGYYFGLSAGFARSKARIDAADLAAAGITTPSAISGLSANGASFGAGGGLNWQAGSLVFGLEGDWSHVASRTDIAFAGTIPPFGGVSGTLGADLDWIATARARAGFSVGRALVYGTAGLAVARASGELVILGVGAPVTFSDEALLGGWVIGGGVEYALSPVWTLKGEVFRMHFGTGLFSSSAGAVPLSSSVDVYNLRAGINYKF